MLYLKARSTLNFWRREESNINPDNCKENAWKEDFLHEIKYNSLMRGQNFVIRITKINRQVEADKY